MVKTSCGAQQTTGSSFLGYQVAEYWNEFKRTIYQPFTKLSVLGAVKLWSFLLLLGSSSLGSLGFGNLKGKWNRFLKQITLNVCRISFEKWYISAAYITITIFPTKIVSAINIMQQLAYFPHWGLGSAISWVSFYNPVHRYLWRVEKQAFLPVRSSNRSTSDVRITKVFWICRRKSPPAKLLFG